MPWDQPCYSFLLLLYKSAIEPLYHVRLFWLQFPLFHLTTLTNKGLDLFWVHCNHAQSCNGYGQTDCFEISGIMRKSIILFYAYKITVKFLFSGISTEPQSCLDVCPRFLENFTISRAALSKLVKYFSKSVANISTTLWLCLDPRKKKFHCDFVRVEGKRTISYFFKFDYY